MADKFVNILNDEEAIRMEAEKAISLAIFIPGMKSKHMPPKRSKKVHKSEDVEVEADKY